VRLPICRQLQSLALESEKAGDPIIARIRMEPARRLHPLLAWPPPESRASAHPSRSRRSRAPCHGHSILVIVRAWPSQTLICGASWSQTTIVADSKGDGRKAEASMCEVMVEMHRRRGRLYGDRLCQHIRRNLRSLSSDRLSSSSASSGRPVELNPAALARVIRSCSQTPSIPPPEQRATQPLSQRPQALPQTH
jgi:hypothetical protein